MHVFRPVRAVVLGAAVATAVVVVPLAASASAAGPAPTVTAVSPTSGSAAGGTAVTITGTGFTGETAVDFGGTAATVTGTPTDTSITATSPAAIADGAVDVTVTTPNGTSATSSADTFTYSDPLPTITKVTPTSGSSSGGTTVTITGTGFTGALDVVFGSSVATIVGTPTDTSITVTSPAGAAGTVDIAVEGEYQQYSVASAADKFTYVGPVELLAIQGGNNALYVAAGSGPFVNYGGAIKGAPAVLSTTTHNYYIVRGTDNNLYVRTDKTGFTHLRPSAALDCATAPAVTSSSAGTFLVGCIGTNGVLYTGGGTLPATGNPTITALTPARTGHLNDDLTAVKGGVGTDSSGGLIATGPAYTAATGANGLAGNTYEFDNGTGAGYTFGGTCAGAPTVVYEDSNVGLVCHAPTSSETLVYTISEGPSGTPVITGQNLHGAALGSPSVAELTTGDLLVYITGTNGALYDSLVGPSSASAFARVPIAGTAASGPAVGVGPVPSRTAALRHSVRMR